MQYFEKYKLKTSINTPCVVDKIWFPQSTTELKDIFVNNPDADILAGCTNVLCSPELKKVISFNKMPKEIYYRKTKDKIFLNVDANCSSHKLVRFSMDNNFTGLEGLYGLPGTVGGGIMGNSGSGKYTISDYLVGVTVLYENGDIEYFNKVELGFQRRFCALRLVKCVILRATFCFDNIPIDNKVLEDTIIHRMKIPQCSAGGWFRNWHALKPYEDQLIGMSVGGAKVSEMVNVIVNYNNATFDDFMNLAYDIQKIVPEKLELEVRLF